jgi:hypothetical protein
MVRVGGQDLLTATLDSLETYSLLFGAARDVLRDSRNATARVRVRNLADSVATSLNALK